MDLVLIFFIAVGLSMDALSISVIGGCSSKKNNILEGLKISLFFGGFQFLMPLIGWYLGVGIEKYISSFDHWVSFLLLSLIGIRMIYSSFDKSKGEINFSSFYSLILLSIVTSIDALIVGISLGLMSIPLFLSAIIIGLVTFLLCFMGYLLGKRIGLILGKKTEIIGGLILIIIGLKTLINHLF
jgi:putative Mn2+ efflux pump MntP